MEYQQEREYNAFGLSYDMDYELKSSRETITGTLSLNADEDWRNIKVDSIESTSNLEHDFESTSVQPTMLTVDFTIKYEEEATSEKFILTISDALQQEELHIRFPSVELLNLYHRLLQPEVPVQAHNQLEAILDDDGELDLYDIINESQYALTRGEFLTIIDRLGEYDKSLNDILESAFVNAVVDWIFNRDSGRFYSITSIEELQSIMREYNNLENLNVITEPILERVIEKRVEYIGRGFNNFIIENIGNPLFPYYDLSVEHFILALGYLAESNSIEKLAEEISVHKKYSVDEYDIGECLNLEGEELFDSLRKEIPKAAESGDIHDLGYGLSQLIRHYLISDSTNHLDHPTRAYLYKSIINISSNTAFSWLAENARHYRHIELAESARESDPERATHHYDRAIVVLSQADEWNYSPNEYTHAISKKTQHEVDVLTGEHRYDEAISLLDERIEMLESLGQEEQTEYIKKTIQELRGSRHETKASKLAEQEQFERARELYNQAAGAYKQANLDALFKGVKGRQYQIDALLAELSGDFDRAADAHQNYVDTLPHSSGAKFHRIRKEVCQAKGAAISGNYDLATSHLDSVEADLNGQLKPAEEQFRQLLQAANRFYQGEIDDLEDHFQSLILGLEEDEERLLDFSDDFTIGLLTVLTAQRLQELPVPDETLEELIALSIEYACYPKTTNQIEGPTKPSVSPTVGGSHDWELSLPTHVINQLDEIRIDQQTTFGDFSALVWRLGVVLEQTLSILREYHARQYWGEEWETKAPGEGRPTIGDLYQFFQTDAAKDLNSSTQIIGVFNTEIVENKLIKELRDALAHGRNPEITQDNREQVDEEQFEQLFSQTIDMTRIATTDFPVIGYVDSQFSEDTYKITLQWGGLPKQVWITTRYELEKDSLYYFPREEFDDNYAKAVTIPTNLIEPCRSQRAVTNLQE